MCSEANVTNGIKTDKTVYSEDVNDTVDGNKDESNDTDTSGTQGMDRQPIPMKHPKVKQQNSGEKKKRKKRKKKKSNSITIENEASQTSRDGSAPKEVLNSSALKEVLKSSAPKEVLKSSAPKEVLKSSAPKEILKSSAPKEVLKSSALKEVLKSLAPKEVLKSSAPKELLKSSAPKEVLKSSAPKEDLKSSVIKEKMNLQCQDKQFEKFEQRNKIKTDLNENCEIPFNTCEHNVEGTDQINSFIMDQMGTTIICHVETAESEISLERTASQIAALEEFSCLESRENENLVKHIHRDDLNDKQQLTNGKESTNGEEVNDKIQQSTNGDEVNDKIQQSANGDEVNDKIQQSTNGDEVNDKVQQSTNGDEVNDKIQQSTNGDEVNDKVQQSTNGDEVNNTLQQMMNADQLRHAIHSDKINVKVNVTSTGNYFDGHDNQEETTTLKNGVHSNDIQSPTTNIDERNGKQWKAAQNVEEKKKKGKPLNELAETWHIMHPHTLILDESRQRLTEMYLLRQVMDKEVPANTNMDREKMPNTCNSVTLIKGDKTVHDNSELHKCNDLIDTDDNVTCKYDQIQEEKSVSHNSNTTVVDNGLNADPVFGEKQNKDIDEAEEKSNVGSSLAEDSQRTTHMQVDSILISPTRASSQHTKGPGNSMSESQLLVQLQEQHIAMTKLQAYAQEQKVESNLLTTALRRKLRQKETKLKSVQAQYEQQMMSVLSRLLFLEGHLQREHKQMSEILQEKDDIIRRQKAAITDLTEKNDGLLKALKESHGYSEDNGLIKLENIVVNQNGSIPIQDHGNKVILRAPKSKNGEKTPSKVRFSAMKEILRRHKSSLELYHGDRLETLDEGGLRYGSQENLVTKNDVRNFDRKERCRSLVDYPYGLRDVDEHHNESPDSCFGDSSEGFPNDSKNSSSSSLVNISERLATMSGKPSSKSMPSYGFNELSKSRSVPHALPTVAENDTGNTNLKERPLSLSSVELLVKDAQPSSNSSSTTSLNNVGQPAPSPSNASPPSESNPFKSFKNVFKRRGSKKKKSPIAENQESNSEALKQHFKKFNLS
ncbi:Ras GTPase-activating protein nGAP [Biomphalaria pfeifferi]|uniref:Ras GTPase-activating protein nGAP n=1 Tax=Biomphalaria pfeifferi TaxID=112525 RepID=A0AAD8C0W8_BIOPF|nr:Ras GTPase-activating protein nGAP [Biomphalaria pfeifferi]